MLRAELSELHFIAHQVNLDSIVEKGILCFNMVKQVEHVSVALKAIQDKRANVQVPRGLKLHEYANLYFHARNPMMYLRKDIHEQLVVLRVRPSVLDIANVVITDANAAGDWTRFSPSPEGLTQVNRELTFAEDWTDPNRITYWQKKSAKCAEVLVPKRVPPDFVIGAYVSCEKSRQALMSHGVPWPVEVNAHLFFRG